MSSFTQEFKSFAMKGNVIDLAVGVVIGAAFSKIVSSLVDDVLMPIISLATGKVDFSNLFFVLYNPDGAPTSYATFKAAKEAGATAIGYGLFINAIVQFMIVAFAIFIVVKQLNRLKKEEAAAPTVAPPREEILLTEIRDLLKK